MNRAIPYLLMLVLLLLLPTESAALFEKDSPKKLVGRLNRGFAERDKAEIGKCLDQKGVTVSLVSYVADALERPGLLGEFSRRSGIGYKQYQYFLDDDTKATIAMGITGNLASQYKDGWIWGNMRDLRIDHVQEKGDRAEITASIKSSIVPFKILATRANKTWIVSSFSREFWIHVIPNQKLEAALPNSQELQQWLQP